MINKHNYNIKITFYNKTKYHQKIKFLLFKINLVNYLKNLDQSIEEKNKQILKNK